MASANLRCVFISNVIDSTLNLFQRLLQYQSIGKSVFGILRQQLDDRLLDQLRDIRRVPRRHVELAVQVLVRDVRG